MEKEMVNHPQHYGGASNPYEAIKVIDAWDLDFCLGNTVKYISREQERKVLKKNWRILKRLYGISNIK